MIKAFVQEIDDIKQMRTYRSVHDVILASIFNFCLPQSLLVSLENLSSLVTNVTDPYSAVSIILPSTWAIQDVRDRAFYDELVSIFDIREWPELDKAQIYTHRKQTFQC